MKTLALDFEFGRQCNVTPKKNPLCFSSGASVTQRVLTFTIKYIDKVFSYKSIYYEGISYYYKVI